MYGRKKESDGREDESDGREDESDGWKDESDGRKDESDDREDNLIKCCGYIDVVMCISAFSRSVMTLY